KDRKGIIRMIKIISAKRFIKAGVGLLLLFSAGLWLERKTTANSLETRPLDQTVSNALKQAYRTKAHLFTRHALQQPAQKEKTAGETRKNIQLFKNLPGSQLIPVMQLIAFS